MDKSTAQVVAQARALRTLCAELAHGAAREAFVTRVDEEIAALGREAIRVVVVRLDGPPANGSALLEDLAGGPLPADCALLDLARSGSPGGAGVHAQSLPQPIEGVDRLLILADPGRVFASPLLFGRVIDNCDVVVLVGGGADVPGSVIGGLRRLAECTRYLVRAGAGDPDALLPRLDGAFRDVGTCVREPSDANWRTVLERVLSPERRIAALADASSGRLALHADLLNKHVQAEVAQLKFRAADTARLRRGEDLAEAGGDPREQAELLKSILAAWQDGCRADLAREAEQGVLPFDPRLIANALGPSDLVNREERSAAVTKYPILGARVFQSMLTHSYVVVPDSAAVERMRERLVSALDAQVNKDVDTLNQRARDLVSRLNASAALYPLYAGALAGLRVPPLKAADVERPVRSIALESEAEDKFVRIGFFKRLMEGRMVASMAFSFLTMSAGVFVLFGDPSIKRGLMKFSGVIVIMMVLYFIFSLLVKDEEEKHELDEVLERVRARLNQDVARPLAKVQGVLLKAYGEFVDDVASTVLEAVESVARVKTAERARLVERRKAEDDLMKLFLARRQPASLASTSKTAALITAVERLRAAPTAAAAPALARPPVPGATSATTPGAGAAGAAVPAPTKPNFADLAAQGSARALERAAAAAAAIKPMTASERMALARSQAQAGASSGGATPPLSSSERLAAARAAAARVTGSTAAGTSPATATATSVIPAPGSTPAPSTEQAPAAPLRSPVMPAPALAPRTAGAPSPAFITKPAAAAVPSPEPPAASPPALVPRPAGTSAPSAEPPPLPSPVPASQPADD